ncbi:MAG TPA: hypothetical protein VIL18_07465 [Longimicrobiales bacterium]
MSVSLKAGVGDGPRPAGSTLPCAPRGEVTGLGRTIRWFVLLSASARRGLRRHAHATAALALAAVVAAAACDDPPSGPDEEVYTLATVNGQPLPGPYPDPLYPIDIWEVVEGTLTLRSDGTLTWEFVARCKTDLPPGTECQMDGDGRFAVEGRYSRAEGQVELGERNYMASFETDRVTITLGGPPSLGFAATFVLEFQR